MSATVDYSVVRRKVLVIGLGNADRGDDAVGTTVAEDLRGKLPTDVPVVARRGDMLSLIEDWAGFDALVFVDAAAPLAGPGRIHRFDLRAGTLPKEISLTSSHALGLAEAIELARALHLAPREIIVYAIEGESFEAGAALTPAVAAAARLVAKRIIAEVERMQHDSIEALSDERLYPVAFCEKCAYERARCGICVWQARHISADNST